jgi:hypothetical protein
MTTLGPKRQQRAGETQACFTEFRPRQTPFKSRAQVGVLVVQPPQPFELEWAAQLGLNRLSPLPEVFEVPVDDPLGLVPFLQLQAGVLPDGL